MNACRYCSARGDCDNCKHGQTADVSESTQTVGYAALSSKQDEYIKFLEREVKELSTFARLHGWYSKRHHGGQQYRHEIDSLRKAV